MPKTASAITRTQVEDKRTRGNDTQQCRKTNEFHLETLNAN